MKILSKQEIINRIANGQAIIIYDNLVLRVESWIPYHPGGAKSIHHMIGRDATDEMNSYHSEETQRAFRKYKIGAIDYKWENLLPPIQGGIYKVDDSVGDLNENADIENTEENTDIDNEKNANEEKIKDEKSNGVKYSKFSKIPVGTPAGKVTPVMTSIPHKPSTSQLKEAYSQKIVHDPEDILDNYDNKFVQKDVESLPSLDYETQTQLSEKYNALHVQVIEAGLYKCNYWAYFKEATRISCLLLWSYTFYFTNHLFFSAVCLGCAWQQMTFIVHDAAHISITHNYQFDSFIGMTIASWIGGLSSTWWKSNHNVHHLVTNDPVHDPDIQHLPFFAVSTRLFKNVYSTYYEKVLYYDALSKIVIQVQNYMYYPLLAFGRFNLYRLSWVHLLYGLGPRKGKAAWFRYYEFAGLSFFFYWYFYLFIFKTLKTPGERWQYVLVSHISTMAVHVQITLSHFAMSTSDLGTSESFPSKQLRTTMDVDCPEWFDFVHGGLQFQAIHHLFPRLPRHNFRAAQPYVIEFCKQTGLKYSIYGFSKGNQKVLSRLEKIARQAKIFGDCVKSMEEEAKRESGYGDKIGSKVGGSISSNIGANLKSSNFQSTRLE